MGWGLAQLPFCCLSHTLCPYTQTPLRFGGGVFKPLNPTLSFCTAHVYHMGDTGCLDGPTLIRSTLLHWGLIALVYI
jgi:hypothetical protein